MFVGRGSDGAEVPAFRATMEDLSAARADTDRYEAVVAPHPRAEDASLLRSGGCEAVPRASFFRTDPPFEWITQAYQGMGVVGTSPMLRLAGVEQCIQGFRILGENGEEQYLFFVGTWVGSHTDPGHVVSIRQMVSPGKTVLVENPTGAGAVTVRFESSTSAVEMGAVLAGWKRSFTAPLHDDVILVIERPQSEGPQAPVRLYAHFGGLVNEVL